MINVAKVSVVIFCPFTVLLSKEDYYVYMKSLQSDTLTSA